MTRVGVARATAALATLAVVLVVGGTGRAARPQPPVKLFPASTPEASTVKVTLLTVPAVPRAFVFWGKRKLGLIAPKQPLVLQRPRDSGPMDLILQAEGHLPVQTRVFTFGDSKVTVKLTPLDQKNTLLGYRQELPPDVSSDGGVPPTGDGGASAPRNAGATRDAGARAAPDAGAR